MANATTYAETAALLAVMEGDTVEAERLVADMTHSEQRSLLANLRDLTTLVVDTPPTIL